MLLSPVKLSENHDLKERSLSNSGHPVVIYLLVCVFVVCAWARALNTVNGGLERNRGHSANKSSFFSERKEPKPVLRGSPEDVSPIHKPCLAIRLECMRMHVPQTWQMTRTSYAHEKDLFCTRTRIAARRAVCSLCDLHRLPFAMSFNRIMAWRTRLCRYAETIFNIKEIRYV